MRYTQIKKPQVTFVTWGFYSIFLFNLILYRQYLLTQSENKNRNPFRVHTLGMTVHNLLLTTMLILSFSFYLVFYVFKIYQDVLVFLNEVKVLNTSSVYIIIAKVIKVLETTKYFSTFFYFGCFVSYHSQLQYKSKKGFWIKQVLFEIFFILICF